jgi:hypothetical protein
LFQFGIPKAESKRECEEKRDVIEIIITEKVREEK